MDFSQFEAVTFDCYGTLIDWERGILEALRPVFDVHGVGPVDDEDLLEAFGRHEATVEKEAFRPYRAVLEHVLDRLGEQFTFTPTETQRSDFGSSVSRWPAFPDSTDALRRLGERYRLAIVSNVDDDLFAGSAAILGVAFDEVVTAQQVGHYKPAPAHFHEVIRRLDLPKARILHVAQSRYHDIAPATALGLRCAWVDRRAGKVGGGATAPSDAVPDLRVTDMAALATELLDFK